MVLQFANIMCTKCIYYLRKLDPTQNSTIAWLFFSPCSTGVWTQGLMLARQEHYDLNHFTSPHNWIPLRAFWFFYRQMHLHRPFRERTPKWQPRRGGSLKNKNRKKRKKCGERNKGGREGKESKKEGRKEKLGLVNIRD
jgi:hypothetical protein